MLTDRLNGILTLGFSVPTPTGQVAISVAHCLAGKQGIDETFPATLELWPSQGCRLGADIQVLGSAGLKTASATSGHLRLDSASFAKGGRVTGELTFVFPVSPSDEVTVAGTIDLPLVRIPVEHDWKDP